MAVRLFPWALLVFIGIRGVNLAATQLPFNGWDEFAHIAAAYYVHEYGRMPNFFAPMPKGLKAFAEAHPHPTAGMAMLRGIDAKPYPGGGPSCGVDPPRRSRMTLYEAQQGPLFYHLAAMFLSGSDPESLLAWVDGVRLINVAMLLGTVLLWRGILHCVIPRDGPFGWLPDGVMLLLGSFSYVAYNFVRFSNDALALFIGTAALALYVVWIKPKEGRERGQLWRYGLLGTVTGMAVLAKATVMVLIPVFTAALVWQGLRRTEGERRRILGALACLTVFTVGYAAVAGYYHLECLSRFGQLTGMQEAVLNGFRGHGGGHLLQAAGKINYGFWRNPIFYNSSLYQAGWSDLISPSWMDLAFQTLLKISVLALAIGLLWRKTRRDAATLLAGGPELFLLLVAGAAALAYHAAQSALCWGVATTGPWYGMLSLPVLFLLYLFGPALCGGRASVWFVLLLALLFNSAHMEGTYGALLFQQTGQMDFYKAMQDVLGHHALLHLDLNTLVVAEFVFMVISAALVSEEILDPAGFRNPERLFSWSRYWGGFRKPERDSSARNVSFPGVGPDEKVALQVIRAGESGRTSSEACS